MIINSGMPILEMGGAKMSKEQKQSRPDSSGLRKLKFRRQNMEQRWIPVAERLPEDGTYLTTLDGELVGQEEPFTGMCGIENGKWDEDGCVIAWMPLPEPYRESEEEQ